jgi:hypothetical protein
MHHFCCLPSSNPHASSNPLTCAALSAAVCLLCSQGLTMADALRRLGSSGVQLVPLEQSAFVKPQSILFELDGGCVAAAVAIHAAVSLNWVVGAEQK